ncbi:MAG: DUF3137 domain-containing protein [Clostridia bacterium]|nr:DUF3137 domain-containing protein [Clostridia bacterium]
MKDFNQIYQKIYDECYIEIEQKRRKFLITKLLITIIVISIISLITFKFFHTFILALVLIIIPAFVLSFKFNNKYNTEYKNTIISKLVPYYDENLKFEPTLDISRKQYNQAEFESYKNFYSNDYIYGNLNGIINFELSDIRTTDETEDEKGNKKEYTVFQGLFSVSDLKLPIPGKVKIRSDKGLLGKFLHDKTQMSMDSQEFEKYFDVYAEDKILAMRILTSDIMDHILQFKKENKIKFEITIKTSHIYIRIHCKNMFEGSILKNALDFKTLHTYYKYLDFMCELNKKLYNILEEKDF